MILAQIALLIYGVVILLTGYFDAFQIKPLDGKQSRVVGLLFCLPLLIPIGLGALFAVLGRGALSRLVTIPLDIAILLCTLYAVTAFTRQAPRAGTERLPEILTPEEAAAHVDRPLDLILDHIEQDTLAARRRGDVYQIDRDALIAYAQATEAHSLKKLLASLDPLIRYVALGIGVVLALSVIWSLIAWVGSL